MSDSPSTVTTLLELDSFKVPEPTSTTTTTPATNNSTNNSKDSKDSKPSSSASSSTQKRDEKKDKKEKKEKEKKEKKEKEKKEKKEKEEKKDHKKDKKDKKHDKNDAQNSSHIPNPLLNPQQQQSQQSQQILTSGQLSQQPKTLTTSPNRASKPPAIIQSPNLLDADDVSPTSPNLQPALMAVSPAMSPIPTVQSPPLLQQQYTPENLTDIPNQPLQLHGILKGSPQQQQQSSTTTIVNSDLSVGTNSTQLSANNPFGNFSDVPLPSTDVEPTNSFVSSTNNSLQSTTNTSNTTTATTNTTPNATNIASLTSNSDFSFDNNSTSLVNTTNSSNATSNNVVNTSVNSISAIPQSPSLQISSQTFSPTFEANSFDSFTFPTSPQINSTTATTSNSSANFVGSANLNGTNEKRDSGQLSGGESTRVFQGTPSSSFGFDDTFGLSPQLTSNSTTTTTTTTAPALPPLPSMRPTPPPVGSKPPPPTDPKPSSPRALSNEEQGAARKILNAYRRSLSRNKFESLSYLHRQRHQVVQEILDTEKIYIQNLADLMNDFMAPLQSQKILTQQESEKLFCNVKDLYDLDTQFLRQISERVKNWTPRQQIANLLYEYIRNMGAPYTKYVNNFSAGAEGQLSKTNKKFQKFVANKKSSVNSTQGTGLFWLSTLLVAPVKRLVRVELLIANLVKFTPKIDIDYADTQRVYNFIKELNEGINNYKPNEVQKRHSLKAHGFAHPAVCFHCKEVIWGFTKQGVLCSECKQHYHQRCQLSAFQSENCKGTVEERANAMLEHSNSNSNITAAVPNEKKEKETNSKGKIPEKPTKEQEKEKEKESKGKVPDPKLLAPAGIVGRVKSDSNLTSVVDMAALQKEKEQHLKEIQQQQQKEGSKGKLPDSKDDALKKAQKEAKEKEKEREKELKERLKKEKLAKKEEEKQKKQEDKNKQQQQQTQHRKTFTFGKKRDKDAPNPDFESSDPTEIASVWIPKMKKMPFSILVTIKNESSLFFECADTVEAKGNWRRKPPQTIYAKAPIQFGVESKIGLEGNCLYKVDDDPALSVRFVWLSSKEKISASMITAQELKERIEITKQEQSTDKFCDVCFTITDFSDQNSSKSETDINAHAQTQTQHSTTSTNTITTTASTHSNSVESSILNDLKKDTDKHTNTKGGDDSDFSDSDDEREKRKALFGTIRITERKVTDADAKSDSVTLQQTLQSLGTMGELDGPKRTLRNRRQSEATQSTSFNFDTSAFSTQQQNSNPSPTPPPITSSPKSGRQTRLRTPSKLVPPDVSVLASDSTTNDDLEMVHTEGVGWHLAPKGSQQNKKTEKEKEKEKEKEVDEKQKQPSDSTKTTNTSEISSSFSFDAFGSDDNFSQITPEKKEEELKSEIQNKKEQTIENNNKETTKNESGFDNFSFDSFSQTPNTTSTSVKEEQTPKSNNQNTSTTSEFNFETSGFDNTPFSPSSLTNSKENETTEKQIELEKISEAKETTTQEKQEEKKNENDLFSNAPFSPSISNFDQQTQTENDSEKTIEIEKEKEKETKKKDSLTTSFKFDEFSNSPKTTPEKTQEKEIPKKKDSLTTSFKFDDFSSSPKIQTPEKTPEKEKEKEKEPEKEKETEKEKEIEKEKETLATSPFKFDDFASPKMQTLENETEKEKEKETISEFQFDAFSSPKPETRTPEKIETIATSETNTKTETKVESNLSSSPFQFDAFSSPKPETRTPEKTEKIPTPEKEKEKEKETKVETNLTSSPFKFDDFASPKLEKQQQNSEPTPTQPTPAVVEKNDSSLTMSPFKFDAFNSPKPEKPSQETQSTPTQPTPTQPTPAVVEKSDSSLTMSPFKFDSFNSPKPEKPTQEKTENVKTEENTISKAQADVNFDFDQFTSPRLTPASSHLPSTTEFLKQPESSISPKPETPKPNIVLTQAPQQQPQTIQQPTQPTKQESEQRLPITRETSFFKNYALEITSPGSKSASPAPPLSPIQQNERKTLPEIEKETGELMVKCFKSLEGGKFQDALNYVVKAIGLFAMLPEPVQKKTEIMVCVNYRLALKLLVAKERSQDKNQIALYTTMLARLVLQPKHKLICTRMAIKSNLDVLNYGIAAQFIRTLLPLNLSDKATQEQRLELCEKNGLSNQIDVEKMISCDTLVAIEPTKARICSFCGFGSAEQSEQCSLCDIGSV